MKKRILLLFLSFLICFSFVRLQFQSKQKGVFAKTFEELKQQEEEIVKAISEIEKQKESLSKQIGLMETKEKLTKVKISQTQENIKVLEGEIASLSAKISRLDLSLDSISKIFLSRITATYKMGLVDPLILFFSSKDLGDFLAKYKYLRVIQLHDRSLLLSMEETKVNYDEQKKLKEKAQEELTILKKQLEQEKVNLIVQLADRRKLLEETKGKETEYQRLLAATRAELEAIQNIIAGKGEETEVGKVNQGDRVATVIYGASPCSTGTHLHFEIRENGEVRNPFSYLKSINLIDKSGGDPHSASGNWDWPLNEPIKFNQGFGENTSAIRAKIVWYKFHTGIDLNSDDRAVKAVKKGTLYRGGVACGSGTLRYVRVDHDNSNIDTYYLHVDY